MDLQNLGRAKPTRHVDNLLNFGCDIGELGYVIFYNFGVAINELKVWDGGMSFHGGFLGVICGHGNV